MPVEVRRHSTIGRALRLGLLGLSVAALLVGLKRLSGSTDSAVELPQAVGVEILASVVAPVLSLRVAHGVDEAEWSKALAQALGGIREFGVQNGRVDVLTDRYAIEVDRLEKWHEGIGQALHYGGETGRVPCLALILSAVELEAAQGGDEKLALIEKTALASGVKLLFLVPQEIQMEGQPTRQN